MVKFNHLPPAFLALGAAFLFGASTPIAKVLLGQLSPGLLAGLLYLGSGLGLTIYCLLAIPAGQSLPKMSFKGADIFWLIAAIAFGGVLGPLFLMIGLSTTHAVTASLFLNLEGVFTALIAWLIFKEHTDKRIVLGMLAIIFGGLVLSWTGQNVLLSGGIIALIGACFCWALDNNFTRNIADTDPIQIAAIKGLVAGAINCCLAYKAGCIFPSFNIVIIAAAVGLIGYGISLTLFIKALRYLGTARTGAYFSTAPFVGAIFSLVFLHEPLTINLVIASLFMICGVALHMTEVHAHEHIHPAQEHDHMHVHDEHHIHEHGPNDPPGEPHSHKHKHSEIKHSHAHFPDSEHRHDHIKKTKQ